MVNTLEAAIQRILVESSAALAKQIGHSVRQSLVAEFMGTGSPGLAPPAPKRQGRPAGSKAKTVNATTSPKAAKAPAVKPVKARRKSYKRRLITQSELGDVLGVIAKRPGLTSVQIQKLAGIEAKQAARVLGKLRKTNKVSVKGKRSAATYTAA